MVKAREHLRSQIQGLHAAGHSISHIATTLACDRKTVRKWIKAVPGRVQDAKRRGRPTKMSPKTKDKVRRVFKDKISPGLRRVSRALNFSPDYIEQGKTISHMTLSRYMRKTEWGKFAYKQVMKPLLSAKNVQDRLRFSQRMVAEGYTDDTTRGKLLRSHILFTDESPIELQPRVNKQNRRIRTSDPSTIKPEMRPKFPLKVMVAGGISRYGKTDLYVVPNHETVNGEHYRTHILPSYTTTINDSRVFPCSNLSVLMQDGATCHTARATLSQIGEEDVKVWTDWPGNSPDLNPIEHIWARLQDSVLKYPRPKNREQLILRVREEWESVTQTELWQLCDSFRSRILECVEKEGKHTKY